MSESLRHGRPGIAWAVILLTATIVIALHALPAPDDASGGSNTMDLLLLEMQSQYIVGTRQLVGTDDRILEQIDALNIGSITQRQCFIALTSEMADPETAGRRLVELQDLIRQEEASGEATLSTPAEERVQDVLAALFLDVDGAPFASVTKEEHVARVQALSADQRESLLEDLGWFGRLLLTPAGVSADEREAILAPAWRTTLVVVVAFGTLAILGMLGLAGLVTLLVLAASGKVESGLKPTATPHGVYAETFAWWIVLFLALQFLGGILGALVPAFTLGVTAIGFLASLSALFWLRFRGVDGATMRADIGWTAGSKPLLEPLIGVGGYLLALPLLGIGIMFTMALMFVDSALAGEASAFTSAAPPAHPIVGELAQSGWGTRLQVLFLAAVVAPIVEETMFRGVLYRHLRDATSGLGLFLSIVISATANGLLFAAIHPQGWVAIPALMSLAFAFVLLREWRGTVLPSMIVHGISNGLVMLMLIAVLGG